MAEESSTLLCEAKVGKACSSLSTGAACKFEKLNSNCTRMQSCYSCSTKSGSEIPRCRPAIDFKMGWRDSDFSDVSEQ